MSVLKEKVINMTTKTTNNSSTSAPAQQDSAKFIQPHSRDRQLGDNQLQINLQKTVQVDMFKLQLQVEDLPNNQRQRQPVANCPIPRGRSHRSAIRRLPACAQAQLTSIRQIALRCG
ncbi:hypothetical protein CJF43_04945 [Pseudomonas fragi]|uniref:Uncharacterized protein n=1 Tax=Pseudomonas fragi TaxID=296 RepID=A0A266LZX3_PSEFR|nr:hypothetical protein CJF43_04945 [Pseudomonas fragi]